MFAEAEVRMIWLPQIFEGKLPGVQCITLFDGASDYPWQSRTTWRGAIFCFVADRVATDLARGVSIRSPMTDQPIG